MPLFDEATSPVTYIQGVVFVVEKPGLLSGPSWE